MSIFVSLIDQYVHSLQYFMCRYTSYFLHKHIAPLLWISDEWILKDNVYD